MNSHIPTKSEKRAIIAAKIKIKAKKGATLAAQISRTRTAKNYSGASKKI